MVVKPKIPKKREAAYAEYYDLVKEWDNLTYDTQNSGRRKNLAFEKASGMHRAFVLMGFKKECQQYFSYRAALRKEEKAKKAI